MNTIMQQQFPMISILNWKLLIDMQYLTICWEQSEMLVYLLSHLKWMCSMTFLRSINT